METLNKDFKILPQNVPESDKNIDDGELFEPKIEGPLHPRPIVKLYAPAMFTHFEVTEMVTTFDLSIF